MSCMGCYHTHDAGAGISKSFFSDYLKKSFPESHIAGCLSNGEIYEGHLTDPETVITAWVFDSAQIKVKLYPLELDKERETAGHIMEDSQGDNLKGVELITVKKDEYYHRVLNGLERLDERVMVFGGASMGHDSIHDDGFSYTESGDVCRHGVIAVFYYGADLHIELQKSLGWQPLGKELTVTEIKGKILTGIDNKSATEIYRHYLGVDLDENFYKNVIEFPLMLEREGIELMREPFNPQKNGGIALVSDLFEGEKVRIAYGDPENIVAETDKACQGMRNFSPEAIMLYSCTARKSFWSYFVNKEMEPFQLLAGTSGFFSGGEVMRSGKRIFEHNITLVAVGFREGACVNPPAEVHVDKEMLHGQLSILQRIATFARATTRELEAANRKLKEYAITDELTKVFNRRELERRLVETLHLAVVNGNDASFIMLDIDYFKSVNDNYGHSTGDNVLRDVSEILREHAAICSTEYGDASVGRYGGEEFVIVLPGVNAEAAYNLAEGIRSDIENHLFTGSIHLTASIGITSVNERDRGNYDAMAISKRVDAALYEAKNSGRNCIRVD